MKWFASIAEEKIREAIRKGEFDDLPGAGKPLPPEDDTMVPEELRVAFKILKNAGALPEEMQLRKDMFTLGDLLAACRDETERTKLRKELSMKKVRYQTLLSDRGWHNSVAFNEYEQRVRDKMTEE
jgi:hypothetical protein